MSAEHVSTKWSGSVQAEAVLIGHDIKLKLNLRREHLCLNLFKGPIGVPVAHFETGLFLSPGVDLNRAALAQRNISILNLLLP